MSTAGDSKGVNGVSLCGGEDNEYGCGQRRGTAEGNVEWKKPNRTKRPNKPNRAKRQTHKRHDGYKRYGSLFCLRSLL